MFKVGNKYFASFEEYEDRYLEVNPKDLISKEIKELISNLPKDETSAFTILGNESYNKKDYADAIEKYSRAIELDNKNFEALFFRGLCFSNLEKYKDAVIDFSIIIEQKPNLLQGYLHRANALLFLQTFNDIKSAILDYSTVISKDPTNGIAYFLRGYCYFLLKKEDQAKMDWNESKNFGIPMHNEVKWKKDYSG
jgi:tetratricopeptide (TPR) repeat protein